MKVRFTSVLLVFLMGSIASLEATTVRAAKGKYGGRVTVRGGPAGVEGVVQQDDGMGNFVDTGYTVSTDAAGYGTTQTSNVSATTLLKGHQVRVVFPDGSICGPNTVRGSRKAFASFTPDAISPVTVALGQDVQDDDGIFLETWDENAIWTVHLNPAEAHWVALGSISVFSEHGDLDVELLSTSAQDVSFRILSDVSPLTPNDLFIAGLGVNALPSVTSITPQFGLQGSVKYYLNNDLLGSDSSNGALAPGERIDAVPEPGAGLLVFVGISILLGRGMLFTAKGNRKPLAPTVANGHGHSQTGE